ncbi:MAG: DUF2341 domain-containing protein, partial [Thermoguttaceae bacterium]
TPTATVTANTTLSEFGGSNNIATDGGVVATDKAAPVILAKETADLNSDGFIDAIHITFSEAISDATVVASDWNIAGVGGEAFNSTTNSDTPDDADIYITFTDGMLDTGATPRLTYAQNDPVDADVRDLAGNLIGGAWWDSQWQSRIEFTFDNSGQTENLTDFPVLVSLNPSDIPGLDLSAVVGADVRFTDAITGAELKYEFETWDAAADTATVWVKVPRIDAGSATDYIHVYYNYDGTATYDQTTADEQAVWDTNYKGVWHLDEDVVDEQTTAGVHIDSTGTNNGDQAGNVEGAGQIADGQVFDDTDWIVVNDAADDIDVTKGTVSAWIELNTTSGDSAVFNSFFDGSNNIHLRWDVSSDAFLIKYEAGGVVSKVETAGGAIIDHGDGKKHLVTLTWDKAADEMKAFIDGTQVGTTQTGLGNWSGTLTEAAIGATSNDHTKEFDGMIDEVRLSDIARSPDWIEASYLSQNGSFAFNTFGSEQVTTTDTAAPVIVSKETADLNSDGFIDAIHVIFSEAISDASVEAGDFSVTLPVIAPLAFDPSAGGDTANDEDIFLTFADGIHDTTITPTLAYNQSGGTDVEDLAATPNKLANVAAAVSTDGAATAPTATNMNQIKGYTEGAASVALDDIVVTDSDPGETIRATLTLANPAAGALSIGSGSGESYNAGS